MSAEHIKVDRDGAVMTVTIANEAQRNAIGSGALDRLDARSAAMKARGVDVENLDFEASYGRTSMEYYDGFVFGFYAEARPDLMSVASGGRYDALTRRLGQGAEIPAVGGVLRPDLMLQLEEAGK